MVKPAQQDLVEGSSSIGEQGAAASLADLAPGSHPLGIILIIDDDPRIAKALQRLFAMEGYEVRRAENGNQGLHMFNASPDAVILDLMLPDMSGREICKRMKQVSPDIPVVILSAITDVADKVLLLETGADDYITKPFSPRELLARVQAAIRRSKGPMPRARVTFGDVQLDFATMRATKKGNPVALTAFEFKLLQFFLKNPDRVITREELLSAVWGMSPLLAHVPLTIRSTSCDNGLRTIQRLPSISVRYKESGIDLFSCLSRDPRYLNQH